MSTVVYRVDPINCATKKSARNERALCVVFPLCRLFSCCKLSTCWNIVQNFSSSLTLLDMSQVLEIHLAAIVTIVVIWDFLSCAAFFSFFRYLQTAADMAYCNFIHRQVFVSNFVKSPEPVGRRVIADHLTSSSSSSGLVAGKAPRKSALARAGPQNGFIVNNSTVGVCICVTAGSCSLATPGTGATDGTGSLDPRIINVSFNVSMSNPFGNFQNISRHK